MVFTGDARAGATDDLLTTKEVAARCRVSPDTVTRWYRTGKLKGQKVGPRLLRFRQADVDAIITSGPEAAAS